MAKFEPKSVTEEQSLVRAALESEKQEIALRSYCELLVQDVAAPYERRGLSKNELFEVGRTRFDFALRKYSEHLAANENLDYGFSKYYRWFIRNSIEDALRRLSDN